VRSFSVLLLFFSCLVKTFSQSPDYQEIFGSNWDKALAFENENKSWMRTILERNHIPYYIAVAVVFPELVRYSALRDKMEITLLKTLYINLGDQYANFSIGQFQIKPSFAELIRKDAPSALGRKSGIIFMQPEEFENISDYRKTIVADLENAESEFKYVAAFYKICEKKFRINKMAERERLRFLATAYNYGLNKTEDEIRNMMDKKYFNTKLIRTQNYAYAEVALFWYDNYSDSQKDTIK
jgi:hypothetical protein